MENFLSGTKATQKRKNDGGGAKVGVERPVIPGPRPQTEVADMPNCLPKAAIVCLVLSSACRICDAQEQANESARGIENPFRRQTLEAPVPEQIQDRSRDGGEVPDIDPPGLEDLRDLDGRARSNERVKKTGEERWRAIEKWSRDGAAEAIKELQSQFPADRFPLFSSPEMQSLLRDEATDDKLRLLKKQRCRVALMECSARMSGYRSGQAPINAVLDSSRRLASSLLALEPDLSTRLTILRHDLAVAHKLEEYADQMLESGTGTVQDLAFAAYERIGAEIRLQQEEERQQEQDPEVAR